MTTKPALTSLKISVIGAGHMGAALVKGLVDKSFYPQNISVYDVEKKKLESLKKIAHIKIAKSVRQCVSLGDVVILAVKPQVLPPVAGEIATSLDKSTLIISIAAGLSIASLESFFKKPAFIVRAMPNMPALVGAGISAFSMGRHCTDKHHKITEAILGALGEAVFVQEKMLDLVTAVSGSGPAYFFLLAEKLIEAAYEMGMKIDLAKRLVYQTAFGSGKIMTEQGEDPEALIEKVASKGGTTEAALKIFKKEGFGKIIQDAVKNAYLRSKEISENQKR